MTTTLSVKTIAVFKAVILFVSISITFDVNTAYAGINDSSNSKVMPAFVNNPYTSKSDLERNPSAAKAEMDEYMIEVKNSLLKEFNILNKQIDNHNPKNANKILTAAMKMRIVELEAEIEKLETEHTIETWKKRFSFTKKAKAKVKTKISLLEEELGKNIKELFVIQKLLTESEIKENKTDNKKKTNRKINSI